MKSNIIIGRTLITVGTIICVVSLYNIFTSYPDEMAMEATIACPMGSSYSLVRHDMETVSLRCIQDTGDSLK